MTLKQKGAASFSKSSKSFPGTEATGARGRDSLVAFARALELRGWSINPVVRYRDEKYGDSLVFTKDAEGAQQLSYRVELIAQPSSTTCSETSSRPARLSAPGADLGIRD